MKRMLTMAIMMIAFTLSALASGPAAPTGKYVFKKIPSTIGFLVRYGNYIGHASEGVWWLARYATVTNVTTGEIVQASWVADGVIRVSNGDVLKSVYGTDPGVIWAGTFYVNAQHIANGAIEIKLFRQ